ncbi:cysteine synthase A [Arthrobacter woluwensis]|uniref:Cysteine synthase A n=2 Tax=Arthrobacter woluwensis TaxID=156980 RepID=A0A1H4P596_9MICC|nr:cysteine synthase A [Arthrobacter woluwensis]
MLTHPADFLSKPVLLTVRPGFHVLRFESMKVASAVTTVRTLLNEGRIDRGSILVDSSSGIYAVALAMAAHKFGLRCKIFASTTVDAVTQAQLKSLGAEVESVPPSASLKLDQGERVRRVQAYIEATPDAYWMRQYHDPLHYDGYAEIASELTFPERPEIVHLVGSVGSGASTKGISNGLKSNHDVVVHGIQPFGSVTFSSEHVEDPDMIIAGIGSAIHFDNVERDLYRSIDWLSFGVAATATATMYQEIGLFAGLSSGCAYLVADKMIHRNLAEGESVVMIAPDTGHRYAQALLPYISQPVMHYDELAPIFVRSRDDLALPWSRLDRAELPLKDWNEF